jgi:DNA-binding NarL/FixJ family response regulator
VREAVRSVRGLPATVVLLDLFMPGPNGIEVLAEDKRAVLATELVVLTSSHDHEQGV